MPDPESSLDAGPSQESASKTADQIEHQLTKAEQHFDQYLQNLKLKVEDGSERCMVGRRARDVSGRWIYVCFPCGALCSGENVLQVHISGNKHRFKLMADRVWPISIFDYYPTKKKAPTPQKKATTPTNTPVQTKTDLVLDAYQLKYEQYRSLNCHLQESLDKLKSPILGVEYLIEHAPAREHYSPSYMCTLCMKQGQSLTILNHLTSYWHRYTFLIRHFPTACDKVHPYVRDLRYRTEVAYILTILAQRIEDKYGRKRPVHIDKDEYERDKNQIHGWVAKDHHFSERDGSTFEEVINEELLESLFKARDAQVDKDGKSQQNSPSVVLSELKAGQNGTADSVVSKSNFSGEQDKHQNKSLPKASFEQNKLVAPYANPSKKFKQKQPDPERKQKMAEEMCTATEESAKQTLAYHMKNPEKHPLYPEVWRKFWNKRYKEIQAEGKDPAKHDFKPEWIVFWTARMKEMHEEELRVQLHEIYRKLGMAPPDVKQQNLDDEEKPQKASSSSVSSSGGLKPEPSAKRSRSPLDKRGPHERTASRDRHKDSSERLRSSPARRRSSADRRRPSPGVRRSTPDRLRPTPDQRRLTPDRRRLTPDRRRPTPDRGRSFPDRRRPTPDRGRSSPDRRRLSTDRFRSPPDLRRPIPDRRRPSPDRRRPSPDQRRSSPDRRRPSPYQGRSSPERRRLSPERRRLSPDRRRLSPDRRRSPPDWRKDDRRRTSADPHKVFIDHPTASSEQRKGSLDPHKDFPERRRASPDRHKSSPDRRMSSPDRCRPTPDQPKALPDSRTNSADEHKVSLDQRSTSSDRFKPSSDRHIASSDRHKASPDRRIASFDRNVASSDRRKPSPDHLKFLPEKYKPLIDRRRSSPDRRRPSPGRNRSPPDQRRYDYHSREPQSRRPDVRQDHRYHNHTRPISSERHHSPPRHMRPRSRSPLHRRSPVRNTSHERARQFTSPIKIKVDRRPDNSSALPFDDMMATLRQLVALEDYLGSLGPRIVDLLSEALTMEKQRPNSSEDLLERDSALVLLETAKEKLKGAAQAGLVSGSAAAAVRAAVVRVAATLHEADKRLKRMKQESLATAAKVASIPVSAGEVDRAQIAQQIAVELIAQGKTDVTSEQLAQLVEAVVSMTEAKKRQNEMTNTAEASDATGKTASNKLCGTASALQTLQAEYGKKDIKSKDEKIDLSDSDVKTLLKNFHQLSSEEQYNLAEYLKKLEAKEPKRVELLSHYVNNVPTTVATPTDFQQGSVNQERQESAPVEASKDHTEQEVIHSVAQNDQKLEIPTKLINQEKSLESYLQDITKDLDSSSDLFALIQGLKSSSAAPNVRKSLSTDAIVNSDDLDSFDDLLEDLQTEGDTSQPQIPPPLDSPKQPATVMTPMSLSSDASSMESSNSKQGDILPLRHKLEQPEQLSPQLKSNTFPTTQHFQQSSQHQPYNDQNLNLQTQQNMILDPDQQNRDIRPQLNDRQQQSQIQFSNNNMQNNRGPTISGSGNSNNPYNQSPRFNYMNGRGQNNYETRPQNMNNQFVRFDNQQNDLRGRGRGFFNAGMRGRGRGYY